MQAGALPPGSPQPRPGALQSELRRFLNNSVARPSPIRLSGDRAWEPVFLASPREFMPYTN